MNCQKVDNLLSAYIDREVSPEESREIWLHLEECENCTRAYIELSQVKETLSSLSEVELPPDFHSRVLGPIFNQREPLIEAWLRQFKPLVFAGALGLLFAVIGLPLVEGTRIFKPTHLADDLRFLLSEHQRFKQSEPLSSSMPPIDIDLDLGSIPYRPVPVEDYFVRTVAINTGASRDIIQSHHLEY